MAHKNDSDTRTLAVLYPDGSVLEEPYCLHAVPPDLWSREDTELVWEHLQRLLNARRAPSASDERKESL